jgi:hypothetical protein
MELAIGSSKLKSCDDWHSAVNTHTFLTSLNYPTGYDNLTSVCPMSCQQRSYTYIMKPFHLNSIVDPTNKFILNSTKNGTLIILSYETILTEEREETLVYDATNFLVNAGGNLGLFLGFSCLSILLYIIKLCKKSKLEHFLF